MLSLVFAFLPSAPAPTRALAAEPLGINITAGSFTQKGDTPFGPLVDRVGVPELLDGLHVFGICAHIEVRNQTCHPLFVAVSSSCPERLHDWGT